MKHLVAAAALLCLSSAAFARPFYCDGDPEPAGHPLSFARLSPQADAWLKSKSSENFGRYVRYVRDRFKQVQPIDTERAAAYTRALDALADATYPGARLSSFENKLEEDAQGHSIARVQVRSDAGDVYVTFDVPCTTTPEELATREADKANIVYANALIDAYVELDQWKDLLTETARLAELHLSLIRDGLPMWPWELWLNGYRADDHINKEPHSLQWVALRPSAGVELSYPSRDDAEAQVRLGIEPIGFVRYIGKGNDRFKTWIGASALITLGSDDGAGFGGLLRYNNYWLGATTHSGKSDFYLFVGLDLYVAAEKLKK